MFKLQFDWYIMWQINAAAVADDDNDYNDGKRFIT